jgi:tetratricopeptide (TPR) repeat protein
MVLPVQLLPYYPYPRSASLGNLEYASAAALVIAITAACFLAARKRPVWPAVWAFYLISLLPVLGLVKARGASLADRYTYLTTLGLFLLAGLGATRIWKKAELRGRAFKLTAAAAAAAIVVVLCFLTLKQIAVWNNTLSLWTSVIEAVPNRVPTAYNNRGMAFEDLGMFDRAVADFTAAIELDPSDPRHYVNRGRVLGNLGRHEAAIADASKAIALNPAYAEAYTNRGLEYLETGRFDRALEDFTAAVRSKPSYADAYLNRGVLYERTGRPALALADYDAAIALDPGDHLAYGNRAGVYGKLGRSDKAIEDWSMVIALQPGYAEPYLLRARLYAGTGRQDLAERDLETACSLESEAGCEALQGRDARPLAGAP